MVICQDFVIYVFLLMFPPQGISLSAQDRCDLSIQISSFFMSIEATFLLIFVTKHFQIRTEEQNEIENNDEDCYDDLLDIHARNLRRQQQDDCGKEMTNRIKK